MNSENQLFYINICFIATLILLPFVSFKTFEYNTLYIFGFGSFITSTFYQMFKSIKYKELEAGNYFFTLIGTVAIVLFVTLNLK